jgi:uncharacterized protein
MKQNNYRVYKCDAMGREVLSYLGTVMGRGAGWVYVRAVFQPVAADIGPAVFYRGDVFHEWFYSDRWYNVFRVHRGADNALRGWYCNITRPATITDDDVRSDDLALDVFITPDEVFHLLDEDELMALNLPENERIQVLNTVDEIWAAHLRREPPFVLGASL